MKMDWDDLKIRAIALLKRWWGSLLLIPFIYYTLHQLYWALRYNIFNAVNYDFPFPVNIVQFFLDNFLLLVHEAGHTFFSIFGVRFITVLGGSLFQLMLPAAIFIYTRINNLKAGRQFALYLFGLSWLNVATYAADGGQQQLPLIGGLSSEYHDWLHLLSGVNLLHKDWLFGLIFGGIGILCYGWALLVSVYYEEYSETDLDIIND